MILLFATEVVQRRRRDSRYWGALAIMCVGMLLSYMHLRSASQQVVSRRSDTLPLGENGSFMMWDKRHRIAQTARADVAVLATHEPLTETIDADGRPIDERYWLYRHRR